MVDHGTVEYPGIASPLKEGQASATEIRFGADAMGRFGGRYEVIAGPVELVRGEEIGVVEKLLPRVTQGSIALDMAATERIDAAGIAALITLYCAAVEAGHSFRVVSPSEHVRCLLSLCGLDALLTHSLEEKSETTKCVN